MRRRKNKKQIKVGWIILGIILFFIALFGLYFNRSLTYQQAVEKANQYQQQGLYCSGYKGKSCEVVFRDKRTGFEKATIDLVDLETTIRIYNEYKK